MNIELLKSGKVRDVFRDLDTGDVYLHSGDSVSAFDSIIPGLEIKGKGEILTRMTVSWARQISSWCAYDEEKFVSTAIKPIDYEESMNLAEQGINEARTTKQDYLEMFPVECVVRGYITGSLWEAYRNGTREFCGIKLPEGLKESDKLPQPIFTPTTKAPQGQHDENINEVQMGDIISDFVSDKMILAKPGVIAYVLKDASINLYNAAWDYAIEHGIIIADTKFEFGWDPKTESIKLGDEILTPDSSRFWSSADYKPGMVQKSMDKQIIRNEIKKQKIVGAKTFSLPPEVIKSTSEAYRLIYEMLFLDEDE